MPEFEVVQIDPASAGQFETLGTKSKFWYDEDRFLFKEGRPNTGENWAEVVCAEVAELLGLPHASYKLALCGDRKGVTTPNFVPPGGRLVLGNELVVQVMGESTSSRTEGKQRHTVGRVAALTSRTSVNTPAGWVKPNEVQGSQGTFAGYLMLDALVGNQDRHEENWGIINQNGAVFLAPTFDHASSLGRNELEQTMRQKLDSKDPAHSIQGYAARAKSQLYGFSGARLSTRDAFREFSTNCTDSSNFWLGRLASIKSDDFRSVLERVPSEWVSDTAREFAVALMLENQRTLLENVR